MMKTDNPSPIVKPLGVQGPVARALQYDNPPPKPANPGVADNVDARLMQAALMNPESTAKQAEQVAVTNASNVEPIIVNSPNQTPTDPFGNAIPVPTADERLRMAAMALLSRMDEVGNHPEFKAMFKMAMSQGVYTGAAGNWGTELKQLKEALGI